MLPVTSRAVTEKLNEMRLSKAAGHDVDARQVIRNRLPAEVLALVRRHRDRIIVARCIVNGVGFHLAVVLRFVEQRDLIRRELLVAA